MQSKQDINKAQWEKTEFPAVCENCLGPNVYTRMTKENYGKECKLCARPFSVFRWLPNPRGRWKRTEICMTCARQKNCCQSCLLDLQYGLPIQVRDAALKLVAQGPSTDINREYFAQNNEGKLTGGEVPKEYEKTDDKARELLKKLANSDAYKRQTMVDTPAPGETIVVPPASSSAAATAVAAATTTTGDELASAASQFRYAGGDYAPPADTKITSLFITGVEDDLPEHAIRSFFSEFGPIKSLVCVHRARSAFVNFGTRAAAEKAASTLRGEAVIRGCPLRVQWGRPRPLGEATENQVLGKRPLIESETRQQSKRPSQSLHNAPIEDLLPRPAPGKGDTVYASTDSQYQT